MSGKKDCKFCNKKGLLILPLRYSVVADENAKSLISDLPATLGEGVKDIALAVSRYAPRMLRQGYLYTLIQREGVKYWEAYAVTEDAYLYKFSSEKPPQIPIEFTCDQTTCGIDASCIAIDDVDSVDKMYFLFTPTPLTSARLAEYKEQAEDYAKPGELECGDGNSGKLQPFDPKAWVKSASHSQNHSLKPELIEQHVPEWLLYKQCGAALTSPLGKAMEQQLFPAVQSAYAGVPAPTAHKPQPGRLGMLADKLKRDQGLAFVVHDHIGVTQTLNNFRNDALTPIEIFLAETTKDRVDNQRRLEVSQAIEDVKAGFIQHGIGIAQKHLEMLDKAQYPDINANNARILRSMGRIHEAEVLEAEAKRHAQIKQQNREKMLRGEPAEREWTRKYQSQLAYDEEIVPFQAKLKSITDIATAKVANRAADHAHWVASGRLVDAFDAYDPLNTGSGFCFTQEHMHCTFGMFGAKDNAPLLCQWFNVSKIERKNLYMRANCFNLKELQTEADKAFANARQQVAAAGAITAVAGAPWSKAAKGLVDGFKKVDSAWDEWLRDKKIKDIHLGKMKADPKNPIHNLSKFHRSCEGLMYARIAEWTQAMTTTPGKLDHGISAVVGMLIYGKLGDLAEKIGFDEFLAKLKAEKIAAIKEQHRNQERVQKATKQAKVEAAAKAEADAKKVEGSIDELMKDEQKKVRDKVKLTLDELDKGERPTTNNFRQARIGCLLLAIESYSLVTKLEAFKGDTRAKFEIAGSMLALGSMSIDIVYSVTKSIREIAPYEGMTGVNKAADLMRGGMKLASGTLSTFAGTISVGLDLTGAWGEWQKTNSNPVLIGVYVARGGAGVAGTWFGAVAAFSYGGPVLTRLAESGWVSRSASLLLRAKNARDFAKGLEAARTLWLIRVARVNLIGLAITGVEIGYRCFIMDNELEDWCQACTFRKDKTGFFALKPFPDTKTELETLTNAFKAITE
jgi:hypothetical protein